MPRRRADATLAESAEELAAGRGKALERFVARLEARTQAFTLPNGLTFVVHERRDAPVLSFHMQADVRRRGPTPPAAAPTHRSTTPHCAAAACRWAHLMKSTARRALRTF